MRILLTGATGYIGQRLLPALVQEGHTVVCFVRNRDRFHPPEALLDLIEVVETDFALEVGVDYIILDGRGGGAGSAPMILRDNINVPTIPALARARKHLDAIGRRDITLVITGGLRLPEDFAKAMMLGADAVAIANSALQAIGCLGMRACGSNNCPVGIATQKENLRSRLIVDASAERLNNFLFAARDLMKVVARACGHDDVAKFNANDLSTFNSEMHRLTGITYAGTHP